MLTVGQPLVPPGAPGNLVATAAASAVTLSWAVPISGGAPTTYLVEAGSASGLADLANLPTGTVATTLSAPGVPDGTYHLRVRAANAAGVSPPSNEAQVIVGAPVVVPSAPTGLTYIRAGSTVTLNWLTPTGGGGTPTSYILEAGSAPGLSDIASVSTGNTATAITASAVPNGTYYVRVRASNAAGLSGPSNEVSIVVGP
jgi:predicted phage tail protein